MKKDIRHWPAETLETLGDVLLVPVWLLAIVIVAASGQGWSPLVIPLFALEVVLAVASVVLGRLASTIRSQRFRKSLGLPIYLKRRTK
jgi:hypothetical protein